jgi:hypothetical protein
VDRFAFDEVSEGSEGSDGSDGSDGSEARRDDDDDDDDRHDDASARIDAERRSRHRSSERGRDDTETALSLCALRGSPPPTVFRRPTRGFSNLVNGVGRLWYLRLHVRQDRVAILQHVDAIARVGVFAVITYQRAFHGGCRCDDATVGMHLWSNDIERAPQLRCIRCHLMRAAFGRTPVFQLHRLTWSQAYIKRARVIERLSGMLTGSLSVATVQCLAQRTSTTL